jgi:hypothetical protein
MKRPAIERLKNEAASHPCEGQTTTLYAYKKRSNQEVWLQPRHHIMGVAVTGG